MNDFNRLHPEIIHTHILPRLDGTTLTALSSVSSEFRRMICNNDKLWKKICTSTWPYLHCWNLNSLLSTFPFGYRSFVSVSDAYPSLHHNNNNNSQSQYTDLPPTKYFIYAIAMNFEGQQSSLFTKVESYRIEENICHNVFYVFDNSIPEIKEGWKEDFQENFTLSWIVIDPNQKRAGSLFHSKSKPFSVTETLTSITLVYKTVMPVLLPGLKTEMVKCRLKVLCCWTRGSKVLWAMYNTKDISEKIVNPILP